MNAKSSISLPISMALTRHNLTSLSFLGAKHRSGFSIPSEFADERMGNEASSSSSSSLASALTSQTASLHHLSLSKLSLSDSRPQQCSVQQSVVGPSIFRRQCQFRPMDLRQLLVTPEMQPNSLVQPLQCISKRSVSSADAQSGPGPAPRRSSKQPAGPPFASSCSSTPSFSNFAASNQSNPPMKKLNLSRSKMYRKRLAKKADRKCSANEQDATSLIEAYERKLDLHPLR